MLLLTLAAALLTTAALSGYSVSRAAAWQERKIALLGNPKITYGIAMALGTAAALVTYDKAGPFAAVAAASATWLVTLYTSTDFASTRLPKEPAHITAGIGLLALLAERPSGAGLLSLAFSLLFLLIVTAFSVLPRRGLGLGFGDVRMIWAITLASTWWWVPNAIFIFYLLACGLQLALRPVYARFAVGEDESEHSDGPDVAHPAPNGQATGRRAQRKALPFGPSIALAYLITLVYAARTDLDVCTSWGLPIAGC